MIDERLINIRYAHDKCSSMTRDKRLIKAPDGRVIYL